MFTNEDEYQHLTLSLGNGWRMSVVQGKGTYSTSGTVEIAVVDSEGKFRRLSGWRDEVCGHVSAAKLATEIRKAVKLAKGSD